MLYLIATILDNSFNNTFVGTLSAGILIAWFGFSQYSKQKELDIKFNDLQKIRDSASSLFTSMEVASKVLQGEINVHNGKNPQLKYMADNILKTGGSELRERMQRDLDGALDRLNRDVDSLIPQLKISKKYDEEMKNIMDKINMFKIFVAGTGTLHLSKPTDVNEYEKEFNAVKESIQISLTNIIDKK